MESLIVVCLLSILFLIMALVLLKQGDKQRAEIVLQGTLAFDCMFGAYVFLVLLIDILPTVG